MEDLKQALENAFRRLLRKDAVSQNRETLINNGEFLKTSFNNFYGTIAKYYTKYDSVTQKKIDLRFAEDKVRVDSCVKLVGYVIEYYYPSNIGDKLILSFVRNPCDSGVSLPSIEEEKEEEQDDSIISQDLDINTRTDASNTTMDAIAVIKLVGSVIRPFSGNAAELSSFIENIELIKLSVPENQKFLAIKAIKGKISNPASAYITSDMMEYDDITTALKSNIKIDSSAVIESRIAAVRFDNRNLTNFTEEMEKLAQQLNTTLIFEGVTVAKATNDHRKSQRDM